MKTPKKKKAVDVNDVAADVKALRSRVEKIQQDQRKQGKLLKYIDVHKSTQYLNNLEQRITDLSSRFQVAILKLTVCSEVPRIYPETYEWIRKALDESDEWWTAREQLTISEWAFDLRMYALSVQPDEAGWRKMSEVLYPKD